MFDLLLLSSFPFHLFSALIRFSGLVGSLGVGLSGGKCQAHSLAMTAKFVQISHISSFLPRPIHTGYNGLPSLISSGLDDSLSDIAAKRKYPFELEKAIHNVMFIQHHMQRQDEFNAVSYAILGDKL